MLKLTWIDFCRQRRTMWACSRAALCWSLRAMDSGFRLLLLPVELTFSRTWLQRLSIGMTLSTQQTTHTVVVDIMIIIVICVILIILTIRVSLLGPGEQWGGGEGGAVQDQDVAGNPPLIQSWSTFDEVWPGMIFSAWEFCDAQVDRGWYSDSERKQVEQTSCHNYQLIIIIINHK